MAIRLRRNLGPVGHLAPLEYTIETASGRPAMCCPECHEVSEIEFDVYRDGRVSQIVSCPYARCSFIDYVELEAWREDIATRPCTPEELA